MTLFLVRIAQRYLYWGYLAMGTRLTLIALLHRRDWRDIAIGVIYCRPLLIAGLLHVAFEPHNNGVALLHVSWKEQGDPYENGRALISVSTAGVCLGFVWLYRNPQECGEIAAEAKEAAK